jgi:diguanylate cyclase (GGDEF)-like protein
MTSLPLAASWGASIAVAAASFALERARRREFRLRARLIAQRELEMQKAVRAFMAASLRSLGSVVDELDVAVRRLSPQIDVSLFFRPVDGMLACVRASGHRAEYFGGVQLSMGSSSCIAQAATAGHRVGRRHGLERLVPGDRAFLALPLADDRGTVGVFYIASSRSAAFDLEDSIATLADLAVPACRLAIEREFDRTRATVDGLTGLLTARAFRERMADACARCRGNPLALLFLDTDNFKACNDAMGHAAGDVVLRIVARTIAESVGPDAIVGRNGGDEFCVLLSGVFKTEAVRLAEGIRLSIEAFDFADAIGIARLPVGISASIGVATHPADAAHAAALLERADDAMYFSKRSGRNRVAYYAYDGALTTFDR